MARFSSVPLFHRVVSTSSAGAVVFEWPVAAICKICCAAPLVRGFFDASAMIVLVEMCCVFMIAVGYGFGYKVCRLFLLRWVSEVAAAMGPMYAATVPYFLRRKYARPGWRSSENNFNHLNLKILLYLKLQLCCCSAMHHGLEFIKRASCRVVFRLNPILSGSSLRTSKKSNIAMRQCASPADRAYRMAPIPRCMRPEIGGRLYSL